MAIRTLDSGDSTRDILAKILLSLPDVAAANGATGTTIPTLDNGDSTWNITAKILESLPSV